MAKKHKNESEPERGSMRGVNQETGWPSGEVLSKDLGWFFDRQEEEAKLMKVSTVLRKERKRPGRIGTAESLGI